MLLGAPGAGAAPAALHAGHPLSGTLWDTRSGRQAGEQTLFAEAAAARWVLLGEKHDNAVHHALQARVVDALGRAGRRFAVGWGMAGPEKEKALAGGRVEGVEALGGGTDWEGRGGPTGAGQRRDGGGGG